MSSALQERDQKRSPEASIGRRSWAAIWRLFTTHPPVPGRIIRSVARSRVFNLDYHLGPVLHRGKIDAPGMGLAWLLG
jgi:hypothetical protein